MVVKSEFPEFDVCFCVHEYAGQPVHYLSILPMAYGGPHHALGSGGLIRVDIKLVIFRTQVIIEDHLAVSDFADLQKLLIKFQSGTAGEQTFITEDGLFELSVSWREETRDILFAGKIPSFEYTDHIDAPLKLRESIYRYHSFQFAMEPTRTLTTISKLETFLSVIDDLSANAEPW